MSGRIFSFEPVYRADARVLVLGTMPSVESLKQAFYYAHPRNAFWPIMAALHGAELPDDTAGKKRLLVENGIALWDVACSCEREGSLDSAIREALPNDIAGLYRACPGIRRVLFNGATAMKLYEKLIGAVPDGMEAMRMPSTSPAYPLTFEKKLEAWRTGVFIGTQGENK